MNRRAQTTAPIERGRRTLYLHIGFSKTGTSTIQEGLRLNHEALGKAGWLIPRAGTVFEGVDAHHNIALDVRGATEFDAGKGGLDELLAELEHASQPNAIVSTEMFAPTEPHQVAYLGRKLAGYRVVVIVYVRRQDLWLHSMWVELCKFPRKKVLTDDFPAWIDRLLARKAGAVENFFTGIDPWGRVFGVDNVRVRVLERSQVGDNVFYDFLAACDVPERKRFAVPPDKNISPGIKTVEILRSLMQPLTAAFRDAELPYQHRKTMVISGFVNEFAELHGWNRKPAFVLDEVTRRKITIHYEESNRALARKYLGREELFLEEIKAKPITAFDLADLPAAEVLDLFLHVLPHFVDWTARLAASGAAGSVNPDRRPAPGAAQASPRRPPPELS